VISRIAVHRPYAATPTSLSSRAIRLGDRWRVDGIRVLPIPIIRVDSHAAAVTRQ